MEIPELPEKSFFSMGEASRIAQVPPHTLRYWESNFGNLKPARRSGGHRRYTRNDLRMIFSIKDMLLRRKLTIAGARRALSRKSSQSSPATGLEAGPASPETIKLLREVKKELQNIVEEMI